MQLFHHIFIPFDSLGLGHLLQFLRLFRFQFLFRLASVFDPQFFPFTAPALWIWTKIIDSSNIKNGLDCGHFKYTSSTSKAFLSCMRIVASLSAFSFRSCCCMWLSRRLWIWHSSINLSSSNSINFWIAFHWFCSLMQLSNSSARRRFFLSRSSRSLRI